MKFKTKMALKVAKITKTKLGSQALDDVTLYFLDDEDLEVGVEVFDMNEEGEYITFPDGTYSWDDKDVIIENGVVKEIREKSDSTSDNVSDDEELKKLNKIKKQRLDEDEPITTAEFYELIDVINDIIDEVEELGGDVEDDPILHELEKTQSKLSKLEIELSKTKMALESAKNKSKGEFISPEGKKTANNKFSADTELKKFNIN